MTTALQSQIKQKVHLTRQMDFIPTDILSTPVTIVGAGAIGSFAALQLAKMGFDDITVIDFDKIDIENMNCQFYRFSDIGKPKVQALKELVKDFTGVEVTAMDGKYLGGTFPGVVVSAVDSMAVRKLIFDTHKLKSTATKFIIDPRMGAEIAALYVTRPMDVKDCERYEQTLYSDEKALQERCTGKAIMYTASMLSGLVAKTVKDCLTGKYHYQTQWSITENDLMSWRQEAK